MVPIFPESLVMRPLLISVSILFLAAPGIVPAAAQQPDSRASLGVGTAVARRGQVTYGVLRVAAGVDSSSSVPVAVVNGARPGPVLALVAGAHGTEYTSIVALARFRRRSRTRGSSRRGATGRGLDLPSPRSSDALPIPRPRLRVARPRSGPGTS